MADPTQIREALFTWDLASEPLLTKGESDTIVGAARAYADLLDADTGPDYDAAIGAVDKEFHNRRLDRYIENVDVWDEAVVAVARLAVDAALAGRRLPPGNSD